jgi:hypothetical protein
VIDPFHRADVLDNSVRRSDATPERPRSTWIGILIAGADVLAESLGHSYTAVADAQAFRFHAEQGRVFRLGSARARRRPPGWPS